MKKKHKTPLQEWASERCYINKGKLIGIRKSLKNIAINKSTTGPECHKLMRAYNIVSSVLLSWDCPSIRSNSRAKFLRNKES